MSRLKRWDDQESWRDFFRHVLEVPLQHRHQGRPLGPRRAGPGAGNRGGRGARDCARDASRRRQPVRSRRGLKVIVQRRVASHLRRPRLPYAEAVPGGDDTELTPIVEIIPAPEVRWVLPMPGGPRNNTSLASQINRQAARSKISFLWTEGLKLQSKSSSVFK